MNQPPAAAHSSATQDMNFTTHLRRTIRLALPVIVARAGLLIMVAVDTAMVGHYDTFELASYAAASAVQIVMILIGVGLLQGIVILVSQAQGAGSLHESGAYWRLGLVHGLVLGVLMGALCFAGSSIMSLIGIDPALSVRGGDVLHMIAWGLPGMMMWVVTSFFLEGLSRPLPGMLMMMAAVVLNGALNWIFIYGNLGVPEMGAEGAAVATSIVRWTMFAGLFFYVLRLRDGDQLGIRGRIPHPWAMARRLRRLGYPLGVARGLEGSAFSALAMLAGLLGTIPLAAHQITLNLVALVFMCAIGTSTASTIRIGNAVGRRSAVDVRRAGWASVLVITVVMAIFAGPFLGLGTPLAGLYSDDPAVIPLAAMLIAIAGSLLVFDGIQAVLMGSLRGMADVWIPPLLQLVSWWGVSVPVGYVLAFVFDIGVQGLIWGMLAGTLSAASLLSVRFIIVSKRPIARY